MEMQLTGMNCPSCGYDLRGLPEHRCPECGRPFDPRTISDCPPSVINRRTASRALCAFFLCLIFSVCGRLCFAHMALWPPGQTMYWYTDGKDTLYNFCVGLLPSILFALSIIWIVFREGWLFRSYPLGTHVIATVFIMCLAGLFLWILSLSIASFD